MACSSLASSSRAVLSHSPFSSLGSTRTILNRARPPRIPILPSPHCPKEALPTSGTSHPIDPKVHGASPSPTHSVDLGDGLTFHHSPPPSMENYKVGSVPPLLKWLGGESVTLSGEESAQITKDRRTYGSRIDWDDATVQRIRELRSTGLSRKAIGESLNIPTEQHRLIARIAPQSSSQATLQQTKLEEQKSTWGYRKRLARAVREKRKEFW